MAEWFQRHSTAHWRHGWTTAEGPDFSTPPTSTEHQSAVKTLVAAAGLQGGAWAHQVHGGKVLRVSQPGFAGEADAVWTTVPGLGVIGRSADCPLVLICGKDATGTGYWAFAHASWRSTVAKITSNVLAKMIAAGMKADRTQAVICPSAGPCCYEVGHEVYDIAVAKLGPEAKQHFPPLNSGHAYDLWAANRAQMEAAGLAPANISVVGVCTICTGLQYPSHRREAGQAGRMAAISGGVA